MKYYHRYAGAKFFMPNGQEISFAGGEFDSTTVKDPQVRIEVERQLTQIANVPASMIYTKEVVKDVSEREVANEIRDTATQGFDTVNKVPAGTNTVAMPSAPDTKPLLNPNAGNGAAAVMPEVAAAASAAGNVASQSLQDKILAAKQAIKDGNGGAKTGVAGTDAPPAGTNPVSS